MKEKEQNKKSKENLKNVLVVAAVKEEVYLSVSDTLITGIGKHNLTKSLTKALLSFPKEKLKDLVVLNIGTAGSSYFEVGTIINVNETLDATKLFLKEQSDVIDNKISDSLIEKFNIKNAVCYSVEEFLSDKSKLEGIGPFVVDMELSSIYDICQAFQVECRSIKIISDNLDSTLEHWWNIVNSLSKGLYDFLKEYFQEFP